MYLRCVSYGSRKLRCGGCDDLDGSDRERFDHRRGHGASGACFSTARRSSGWAQLDPLVRSTDEIRARVVERGRGDRGHQDLRAPAEHGLARAIAPGNTHRSRSRSTACGPAAATRFHRPPANPLVSHHGQARGRRPCVSAWLHEHVRTGDVARPRARDRRLRAAPRRHRRRCCSCSGGSGITPVMSMLRDLAARDAIGDVVFVHHARSRADVIFADELAHLARPATAGLRWSSASTTSRVGAARLRRGAASRRSSPTSPSARPSCAARAGLMDRVEQLWARRRRDRPPASASASPRAARWPPALGAAKEVSCGSRAPARTSWPAAPGTLLEQLERAGERPAYGCRMGICQTCTCRKRSGTVRQPRHRRGLERARRGDPAVHLGAPLRSGARPRPCPRKRTTMIPMTRPKAEP